MSSPLNNRLHLYLVGPGNVGKTTVGPLVAELIGRPFIDLDQEFMTRIGHIGQTIDTQGYDFYRQQNARLLRDIVASLKAPAVIALSSGFLTDYVSEGAKSDLAWVKSTGQTCLLFPSTDVEADCELIADRCAARPYLNVSRERAIAKYRQRFAEYQSIGADMIVYSKESPPAIAHQIVEEYANTASRTDKRLLIYALPSITKVLPPVLKAWAVKTKADLDNLAAYCQKAKPMFVLGLGSADQTRYEPRAINRLHGRLIAKDGPEEYPLYIPDSDWPTAKEPTSSFCNWSAYRLAHALRDTEPPCQIAFLHLTLADARNLTAQSIKHSD